METIKIGIIGMGHRGFSLLKNVILKQEEVFVAAICDLDPQRIEKGVAEVKEQHGTTPKGTTDYRQVIENKDIDGILILSAWESHINIAVAAMKAGKYVGMEVGGAYSIRDCWKLVETYEETGVPCMILENCCYGRTELMLLSMVRKGMFGEVVHCCGGYNHDLRKEISYGKENGHYRLRNYLYRNCENYPTHELGPIAKILNINQGNRMLKLSSFASRAAGLKAYVAENKPDDTNLSKATFAQGDVVTTTITCAGGQTIVLTLDTTLPRYYSRGLEIHGTKAFYQEENDSLFFDETDLPHEFGWKKKWGNAEEYRKKYDHPLWQGITKEEIKQGHGGMDVLVFRAFFSSIREKTQTPIDIYDTASWMCISALSEESIALGGMPVPIPDFTNGKWLYRKASGTGIYSLDF